MRECVNAREPNGFASVVVSFHRRERPCLLASSVRLGLAPTLLSPLISSVLFFLFSFPACMPLCCLLLLAVACCCVACHPPPPPAPFILLIPVRLIAAMRCAALGRCAVDASCLAHPAQLPVGALCRAFTQGLIWMFGYYVSGVPSWSFCYPFLVAPFCSHLVRYWKTNTSAQVGQGQGQGQEQELQEHGDREAAWLADLMQGPFTLGEEREQRRRGGWKKKKKTRKQERNRRMGKDRKKNERRDLKKGTGCNFFF